MAVMDDIQEYVGEVCAHNAEAISRTAAAIAAAGRGGGLVLPAGAGHSLAAVLETFFRAGGLAFVKPLWHERILPFTGARTATAAEREPGLGAQVARAAGVTSDDVVICFSNSGVNPYPVEICQAGRDAGATVVAVTSREASAAAPLRAGARIMEIADIVIDTRVPPGDVTWPRDAPVTAPSSSIATTALWAAILREVHDLAPDLPRWQSANMAGTDAHNAEIVERYAGRIPEL